MDRDKESKSTSVSQESLEDLDQFAQKKLLYQQFSEIMVHVPLFIQRGGIYLVSLMVLGTGLLLYFGKVHRVVTAKGTIVSEGEGILVQAIENGITLQVFAKPGDRLPQGAPLLQLDRPESRLNLASLQRKLEIQEAELQELLSSQKEAQSILQNPEAFLMGEKPLPQSKSLGTVVTALTQSWFERKNQELLLKDQLPQKKQQNEVEMNLLVKRIQLIQKEWEQSKNNLKQEADVLKTKQKQLESFYQLSQKGLYSEIEVQQEKERYRADEAQYRAHQKQMEQLELDISNQQLRLSEMKLQVQSDSTQHLQTHQLASMNYQQSLNQLEKSLLQITIQIEASKATLENTRGEVQLTEQQIRYTNLTMPVTGTLSQMNIKNPGELIRAGQIVAIVMKEGAPLIIQASVSNKDIGFVRPGLKAQVKVEAYPFQQFGTLPAQITKVFPNTGSNADFSIHLVLLQNTLHADESELPLFPGLNVEVDLLTHKERLLYLLLGEQPPKLDPSKLDPSLKEETR